MNYPWAMYHEKFEVFESYSEYKIRRIGEIS